MNPLSSIFKLEGIKFITKLLEYEQRRFDSDFLKGSVFEEININFGPFPKAIVYPVYFAGNIKEPAGKTIFIGINPCEK